MFAGHEPSTSRARQIPGRGPAYESFASSDMFLRGFQEGPSAHKQGVYGTNRTNHSLHRRTESSFCGTRTSGLGVFCDTFLSIPCRVK